jgi:trk system potassium uptake protein TrkH
VASRQKQRAKNRQSQQSAAPRAEEIAAVLPLELPSLQQSMNFISALLWAYAILLMVGYFIFHREGTLVHGNMMSVDRAAFTVVNAGTLTGFQQSLSIDQYKIAGQLMIFGLTLGSTLIVMTIGGILVARIAKLAYSDLQILIAAILLEFGGVSIGAIALWILGSRDSLIAPLLQAASAIGNSGVWIGSPLDQNQPIVHLVLLPLAVIGSLGLAVVMDIVDVARGVRDRLSRHTIVVLWTVASIYLLGCVLILVLQCIATPPKTSEQFVRLLAGSSSASIDARSAGLPVSFAAEFPRSVQWVLILLMAIGASPGSCGGGIKGTAIVRMMAGVRDAFMGRAAGRGFAIAAVWIVTFLIVMGISFLVLLATQPDLNADRLLLLAVSAASNTGLSHDRVAIVGPGLAALSATMLLGRLLPWAFLWWVAASAPEEQVAVA